MVKYKYLIYYFTSIKGSEMDEERTRLVGNRLKTLRHSLNINQRDFAKSLERTQKEVSSWETGKQLIPFAIIFKIKDLHDVPIGYFDPDDDLYVGKVLSKTLKSKSKI